MKPIYGPRTPYTYLIGWSQHQMFYYGSRYGKLAHPSDLWKSYFTSSKYVKKFRQLHGEPDIREVRKTFSCVKDAMIWEQKVLQRIRAVKRMDFLNRSDHVNYRCVFDTLSESHRQNIAAGLVGKVVISASQRETIRLSNSMRVISPETRAKIAAFEKPDSMRNAVAKANAEREITHEYLENQARGRVKRHVPTFKWKHMVNTLAAREVYRAKRSSYDVWLRLHER